MLKTYLAVMLGGAIGTGLRMGVSQWLTARYGETFPLGTLAVNVTGSFLIGLFATLTAPEIVPPANPLTRQVVMIGVFGGYTTFSAFAWQTLSLAHGGDWWRAGLNVVLSIVLCLLAVWLGHLLAITFQGR